MTTFLADARQTVAPQRGSKEGLLPPLLVTLTVVTGLVDAFSYLVYPLAIALVLLAAVALFAIARARPPSLVS